MIAVLGGTGQQGRGIAQRLARAGKAIVVGSRDPLRATSAISQWPAGSGRIEGTDYAAAIASAEIVILAVPFDAVGPLLDRHRADFRPQALVIDVTVPLTFGAGKVALQNVPEGSAAEYIRARLPDNVRLTVAFKTIPAHLLTQIERPLDCDEFVCGDPADARVETIALVESMDRLRGIDVGPLTRARSIEHLTLLAIGINRRHKVADARFRIVGL